MKKIFTLCITLTVMLMAMPVISSAQDFAHPGISHKKSDLERMKYMVQAGIEPWKTSFTTLSANQYASYNYVVKGSSANTVIDGTISSEYNKVKFDGLAAYYNALMWYITGDTRHAQKAVEIFNAWSNITRFNDDGTKALQAGRAIWKFLEAAEIIKNTYSGWAQADIDRFKAMLVYPGYSTTTVPSAAIASKDATFYWYMYNGDSGRHGNQGLFAMRGLMAMGIFLDNKVMYDRALRYLQGLPHRADDLPYPSGPPIVNATPNAALSNEYFDDYTRTGESSTITDYGYNELISNYIYANGQCQESSRDQSHAFGGVGLVSSIAEIAWNQGDDLYGTLNNRILLGLEYALRYNLSYNYTFPDQPAPWEPTVASGEFIQIRDRSGRWFSKKINPWNANDLTRLTRGVNQKANISPIYEQALAHYQSRLGLPDENIKWLKRGQEISIAEFGYEQGGFEMDHPGWGGLAYRRPAMSAGDPCYFSAGKPVFRMNVLPGTIEAEDYDYFVGNGEGKSYHDLSSANTGTQYRIAEGVDVEACAEGGFNVSAMEPGEWINYTVNVPTTGNYDIAVRYGAGNANGTIRFDFDGVNKTGDIPVPFGGTNSTGLQVWNDFIVKSGVLLQAGVQSMRIYVGGTASAFNLNNISLTMSAVQPPAVPTDLTSIAGDTQVSLNWTASPGATGYNIKRATTDGGPYTTVASGVTTTNYTNTGLTNGNLYYYVVSAVSAAGEGGNSLQTSKTPTSTVSMILDNFTVNSSTVTGRIPEEATLEGRVYQVSTSVNTQNSTVSGGTAILTTNIGEAISIASAGSYVKPSLIKIAATFALGTLGNNSPLRPGRGVYLGFWSSIGSTGDSFGNMRGVFVNPDGTLQLWNGSNSSTGTPVQTLPYNGTWVGGTQQHTMSYTIDTSTGDIIDFLLDGVAYDWSATAIFSSVNTNLAGLGVSGAASNQIGYISSFRVWDGAAPTTPVAPTGLTATAGDAQATLSWTAVSGASSYNVKRATGTGGPYTTVATGVTATSYINTGLTNGTAYYYVVSAVNGVGEGANSAEVSATPQAPQAPAAPTGLTATAGDAQVSLSWTASSGATSYNVKRATVTGGPYATIATGVTTTTYSNTGLTNGTTYYYVVSAVSLDGEGANSSEVNATPQSTLLPNPWLNSDIGTATGGSATYNSGVFTVNGAGSDIGGTSDNFNYLYQAVSGDVTIVARLASRVIGGTVNDKVGIMIRESATANSPHAFIFIDAASVNSVANRARFSFRSTSGGSTTFSNGTGQVIPVWLKVERVGNVFTAYVSADGVTYSTVGSSVTISMANTVQVGAAVCSRDASSVNTSTFDNIVIQAATPPVAPTGLTATAGDAQATLSWTAVSGASSYNVKRATGTGGPYTTVATGVTATSYINTGLTNGTAYYYVVSAVNGVGEGANSAEVSATPQAQALAAPTGLTATAGNAQIALSWTSVSGASSYNVKRATVTGGPYTTVASGVTATSYTNTGLTNGTAYYYVLSAVNAAGESANSAQVSATPQATPPPAAPTGLTATAGNAEVALAWTASTGASSYNVKRATVTGGPYTTVASGITATGYTNTGLTNGTVYYFVVSAANTDGEGVNSSEVSATPVDVVASTILQQNTTGGDKGDIKNGQTGSQSFKNGTAGQAAYYIKKLVLHLSRESNLPNANFLVNIGTGRNSGAIAGSSVSVSPSDITNTSSGSSFMTYTITFPSAIGPLTAGTTYYINMSCSANNGKPIYVEKASSDSYANGTYYQGSSNSGKDMWFQLWGGGSQNLMSRFNSDLFLDLTQQNSDKPMSIYPNPVSDGRFFINVGAELLNQDLTVKVTDMSGRLMLLGNFTKNAVGQIEVVLPSSISPGVYIVTVNNKYVLKLLIQ